MIAFRPALFLVLMLLGLVGCDQRPAAAPAPARSEVIIYCSADAPVAQPILDAFQKKTGITVRAVFDTEATKTTGLVNRLLSEHESRKPQCDVWWSSEPFGTIRLTRAGVLAPYTSPIEATEFNDVGGWPAPWRGQTTSTGDAKPEGVWYAFAFRTREIVYNTKYVTHADAPRTLGDLTNPKFKGRIAMARPQFGTTRGHMAAVSASPEFRPWLAAIAASDLRIYDGNATVVRAVGNGEVWIGLTDNDDVEAGKANGWPVSSHLCIDLLASSEGASATGPTCTMPNTVALVRGGPNAAAGGKLIDFLLSAEGQRLLADSEAHATPLHPALAPELWKAATPVWAGPTLESIADNVEPAMRVCDEVLKGR